MVCVFIFTVVFLEAACTWVSYFVLFSNLWILIRVFRPFAFNVIINTWNLLFYYFFFITFDVFIIIRFKTHKLFSGFVIKVSKQSWFIYSSYCANKQLLALSSIVIISSPLCPQLSHTQALPLPIQSEYLGCDLNFSFSFF